MKQIYRLTIHGRTLESADLRKLLSRAVREKRSMDRMLRYAPGVRVDSLPAIVALQSGKPATVNAGPYTRPAIVTAGPYNAGPYMEAR